MKRLFLSIFFVALCIVVGAETIKVSSPDGRLNVNLSTQSGKLFYNVTYNGKIMLEDSPLGLVTNVSDFSRDISIIEAKRTLVEKTYNEKKLKNSHVKYVANKLELACKGGDNAEFSIVMQVSNNDIAYKYQLAQKGETSRCVILKELSGFNFPQFTTTFITHQSKPMAGWMRTKPSYEEGYTNEQPVGTPSAQGVGFTFPALFHVGENGWVLLSETGVRSLYCGSKLSESTPEGLYTIAFPEEGENNGVGSANPSIAMPGETPWRTITVGDNLKPIVETTIFADVVEPLYLPSRDYKFGRSTWSWLVWQDASCNYDDQIVFIDLAASLGYEYVLIDALWDTQIGRDKMAELVSYAKSKGVCINLWYNSNGSWNDAPQSPKNGMSTSIERKKEMEWMRKIGVTGIKVDFFGGDKQETMKLYEDILSDANDYGIMVVFHGCTLPRGWDRMFPNFAGSEAVLASENLIFGQYANDTEAYSATLHPFIRNTVASMDFGPVLLNKRHSRNNDRGSTRKTTETFQLATSVIYQTPLQHFGITPNNLTECPSFVIDFMKNVPSIWDETLYIDGYPGKYAVIARRNGDQWYVAGINAENAVKKIEVTLPMFADKQVDLYSDKNDRSPQLQQVSVKKTGKITLTIQPEGAVILKNK